MRYIHTYKKYQQIYNAYKIHLKNNKKEHLKVKLLDSKTNNTRRAFCKTVKMFLYNQENTNYQNQKITYKMNLLSSSQTKLKKFAHCLMAPTSMNPPPEIAHFSRNVMK